MSRKITKVQLIVSLLYLLFGVQAAKAQEWTTLTPAGEGFSVLMPKKPAAETNRVPISGNDYLGKMYTAEGDSPRALYLAVMQEFPPVVANLKPAERLDNFIGGFRNGFVRSLTSSCPDIEIKLQSELTIKEHSARQYSFDCQQFHGFIRVIDGTQRMYVLLVFGPDQGEHVTKFLQSFEFLPAPSPVPMPKG